VPHLNSSKLGDGLLIGTVIAVIAFVAIGLLLMTGVFNPNTVSIEALRPDSAQTKAPSNSPG